MQLADLHIHSKYSRATSGDMTIESLSKNAKIKGIDILGTGDFTHPVWLKELKEKLSGNGIYEYDNTKFILSGEISLIYTQGRSRRVHHVILAESFDVVDQINEFLSTKGRRDYDGRPIFGFSSVELVERLMSISKDIEIIPAHAWTPWYGVLGSMSGFDSVEECFRDETKHIHALETGLSSDPAMNWRVSSLDKFSLVSFSDAHSPYPYRLGREAIALGMKEINYKNVIEAIRARSMLFTVEVDPNYGKYHFDGHRLCNFSCSPDESRKLNNICPKCGKKLVIGVLNRVEQLADRPEGFTPGGAVPFKSLIPLHEVISAAIGSGVFTQKTYQVYNALTSALGSEFNILLNAEEGDLRRIVDEKLSSAIMMNRLGKIRVVPGYDGVYGKLILGSQRSLGDF